MAQLLAEKTAIKAALSRVQTIALVGASPKQNRASYGVMAFLLNRGFRVIPVNPSYAGQEILGQLVQPSLGHIDVSIDMVDVFRNSSAVAGVLDETLKLNFMPKLFWMQIGVFDKDSAQKAVAAGMDVVMDRCPTIELT